MIDVIPRVIKNCIFSACQERLLNVGDRSDSRLQRLKQNCREDGDLLLASPHVRVQLVGEASKDEELI